MTLQECCDPNGRAPLALNPIQQRLDLRAVLPRGIAFQRGLRRFDRGGHVALFRQRQREVIVV